MNQKYTTNFVKRSFDAYLIEPSSRRRILASGDVYNSELGGYEKRMIVKNGVDNENEKMFTLELTILDKVQNGVLHLINSNEEFVSYYNSPQRAIDILNGEDMSRKPKFNP